MRPFEIRRFVALFREDGERPLSQVFARAMLHCRQAALHPLQTFIRPVYAAMQFTEPAIRGAVGGRCRQSGQSVSYPKINRPVRCEGFKECRVVADR